MVAAIRSQEESPLCMTCGGIDKRDYKKIKFDQPPPQAGVRRIVLTRKEVPAASDAKGGVCVMWIIRRDPSRKLHRWAGFVLADVLVGIGTLLLVVVLLLGLKQLLTSPAWMDTPKPGISPPPPGDMCQNCTIRSASHGWVFTSTKSIRRPTPAKGTHNENNTFTRLFTD